MKTSVLALCALILSSAISNAGQDYESTTATLTIPAWNLTGTVSVVIIGDDLVESDETSTVMWSNAFASTTPLTITQALTIVTFIEDDTSAATGLCPPALGYT